MQRFANHLMFLLVAGLLGACGVPDSAAYVPLPTAVPTATPTPPPTATPAPLPTVTPMPTVTDEIQPSNILVQLDYAPSFAVPWATTPFGRVPRFTLLDDGRVIYVATNESENYDEQVMQDTLSPEETAAFVQQVRDAGFAQLESYTDFCEPGTGERRACVADASTSVIRARQPDGTLREVRNYHTFSNQPEILEAIRTMLNDYRNPAAQPYVPEQAALFISVAQGDTSDRDVRDWPLSPDLLTPQQPAMDFWALVVEGDDLTTLLATVPRNTGDFWFRKGDAVFQVHLTPWLPGADYTEQVNTYGRPLAS